MDAHLCLAGESAKTISWLASIVVRRRGGTDKANFALVEFLLEQDIPVEVVAHEIDPNLLRHPNLRPHLVPVPVGSRFAGEMLLSFVGRQVAHITTRRHPEARVVVN